MSRLIACGGFEYKERQFMQAFLREKDVFLDIGANIGLFSLLASARVGDKGEVHAFEPSFSTFLRLRDNVQVHGCDNVVLHNVALGECEGELLLEVKPEGRDAWRNLASNGSRNSGDIVRVLPLDKIVASLDIQEEQILLIKLDVEGWEKPVLKGGERGLERLNNVVLQVEFSDAEARAAGFSCQELYQYLRKLGFDLYRFELESFSVTPAPMKDFYDYENLYAIRDLSIVKSRLSRRLPLS